MIGEVPIRCRGAFVGGRWRRVTPTRERACPFDLRRVASAFADHAAWVDEAVAGARAAQVTWAKAPLEQRIAVLSAFSDELAAAHDAIVEAIVAEVGKPITEARTEVAGLRAKIDITTRIAPAELAPIEPPGVEGFFDWRPLGVFAVIGPFNFPVHLSHGHIVPALVSGNAVILKPSDASPASAERYVEAWERCARRTGAPAALISLIQGGATEGQALAVHPGVDAVAFTGSYAVGVALRRAVAHMPQKLLALEMGGKNSSLVLGDADLGQAAAEIARAAFETTGQRCTATSRVLVERSVAGPFIELLVAQVEPWRPSDPREPAALAGPLATEGAWGRFDRAQAAAARVGSGLEVLRAGGATTKPAPGWWAEPAVHRVVDREASASRFNEELFGPELLIDVFDSDAEALSRANEGDYGLAAAVFTADRERFARLRAEIRAGLVNLNRRTTGASSALPFGGLGHSGNHRPAGAASIRYCVVPVATLGR